MWWIWIVIAIVAAMGELLTTGLFLGAVAIAALITAVVAIVVGPFVQVPIFAGLTLVGIALVRPAVIQLAGIGTLASHAIPHSESRLVGRRATVIRTVDAHGGQIRIGQGEFWSARADDPLHIFNPGDPVEIVFVDGLTALVTAPQELLAQEAPIPTKGT